MKSTSLSVIAGLGALALSAAQHAHAADLAVARPLLTPDHLDGILRRHQSRRLRRDRDRAMGSPALAGGVRLQRHDHEYQRRRRHRRHTGRLQSPAFAVLGHRHRRRHHQRPHQHQDDPILDGVRHQCPLSGSSVPEIGTLEWLGTLRGRFGYLLTPRTLIYATGGVAWSGVNYAGASSGPTTPGYASAVSFTETQIGYVVGGGVEFLSWDRWLVRGEYLFHHFNGASACRRRRELSDLPLRISTGAGTTSTSSAPR